MITAFRARRLAAAFSLLVAGTAAAASEDAGADAWSITTLAMVVALAGAVALRRWRARRSTR